MTLFILFLLSSLISFIAPSLPTPIQFFDPSQNQTLTRYIIIAQNNNNNAPFVISTAASIPSPSIPSSPPPQLTNASAVNSFFQINGLPSIDDSRISAIFSPPPSLFNPIHTIQSSSPPPPPINPFQGISAFLTEQERIAFQQSAAIAIIEPDAALSIAIYPPIEISSAPSVVDRVYNFSVGDFVDRSSTTRDPFDSTTTSDHETLKSLEVKSWGLDRIDQRYLPLDDKYSPHTGEQMKGEGVIIYSIDTGCDPNHQEFFVYDQSGQRTGSSRAQKVYDIFNDGQYDSHGHGTHTAATAVGAFVGVAPRARVKCLRVLDSRGSGTFTDVLTSLSWLRNNYDPSHPSILTLSIGGSKSTSVNAALEEFVSTFGFHIIAAAGNSATDTCTISPASAIGTIAVGSSGSEDNWSSFSNYGECMHIIAPGQNILSAWPTSSHAYAILSGTSMATPHVSGAIARYLADRGFVNPEKVRRALHCSATANRIQNTPVQTNNDLLFVDIEECNGDQNTASPTSTSTPTSSTTKTTTSPQSTTPLSSTIQAPIVGPPPPPPAGPPLSPPNAGPPISPPRPPLPPGIANGREWDEESFNDVFDYSDNYHNSADGRTDNTNADGILSHLFRLRSRINNHRIIENIPIEIDNLR